MAMTDRRFLGMTAWQWINLGAIVGLCMLAVAQRWWGPLLDDYWRGVIAGGASIWILRGIKAQRVELDLRLACAQLEQERLIHRAELARRGLEDRRIP